MGLSSSKPPPKLASAGLAVSRLQREASRALQCRFDTSAQRQRRRRRRSNGGCEKETWYCSQVSPPAATSSHLFTQLIHWSIDQDSQWAAFSWLAWGTYPVREGGIEREPRGEEKRIWGILSVFWSSFLSAVKGRGGKKNPIPLLNQVNAVKQKLLLHFLARLLFDENRLLIMLS